MSVIYQFCVAQATAGAETWIDAADLGVDVDSLIRTRVHAEIDTVSFTLKSQSVLTADAVFAYNTVIRLRRVEGAAATLLFLGRVQPFARAATGAEHAVSVEVRGMWDWFEKTVMRQDWTDGDDVTHTAPRAVLFCADAARLTTGQQIERCIALAVAGGCPCAAPAPGDIAAGYTPPFDEQLNISVAQAIQICLAYHPHSVGWFDYSERAPRFRVAVRQSLPAFTAALSAEQAESLAITSREDLRPPAVAVAYQKPWADGERSGMHTHVDYAPHVAGETDAQRAARLSRVDVLWAVFDLAGMTAQYQEQEQSLETEPVDWETNKNSWDWWARWCPQLNDSNITSVEITGPSATGSLPNLLLGGAIQEWMGVEQAEDTFTCNARIVTGPLIMPLEYREEKLVVRLKTTDGHTKTYRKKELTAYDSGDSIPEGLAASMLAEWQQLHHDGAITLAAQDAPLGAGPGMTLNITGGRAEWASMAAMITSVTENFGAGRVTVRFGVPQWIDLDSRFAFYRACKNRRYSMARDMSEPQEQGGVEETDDGAAGITGVPGARDGGNTAHVIRRMFDDPAAPVRHTITLEARAFDYTPNTLGGFDFEDPAHAAVARDVHMLEVLVPVESGGKVTGAKRAQVLACAPYGDEVPLDTPASEEEPWQQVPAPAEEIPEGVHIEEEVFLDDGGMIRIDLNSETAQDNAPLYVAVQDTVYGYWYKVPARFIAARFPDRGAEDLSLGIVRGLHNDELSPLMVRLAGVDEPPDGGPQKIYGYFTPSFGSDTNPRWGLWELESLFKADLPNKRLYLDLAGYGNFKPLSADADTWDFNADANGSGKNGATLNVVTDVSWDAGAKKLTVKKRSVTLFKFGLKTVAAASPVESEIETGGQFDVRYDLGSGQLQKSTDGGQNWGMVSGGQTVPETV